MICNGKFVPDAVLSIFCACFLSGFQESVPTPLSIGSCVGCAAMRLTAVESTLFVSVCLLFAGSWEEVGETFALIDVGPRAGSSDAPPSFLRVAGSCGKGVPVHASGRVATGQVSLQSGPPDHSRIDAHSHPVATQNGAGDTVNTAGPGPICRRQLQLGRLQAFSARRIIRSHENPHQRD